MTRFGKQGRVHFWEEPCFATSERATLRRSRKSSGVTVLTPLLPASMQDDEKAAVQAQRALLTAYVEEQRLVAFVSWYYTPMALRFADCVKPALVVYDCMDELSAFQGAPPSLIVEEKRLFARADVVFAGGASLFASKRRQHGNVHLFPSSIDREHFARALKAQEEPTDQKAIPHPRIGFYGVLDERLDRELLQEVAAARPDWHLVLLGPVVKICEEELPRAANLHYLGPKPYAELPRYLAGWDVAMLPFARNASTRFISPTKTPEYLAGGRRVVSTPIQDVVNPYGEMGLVRIGENPQEFCRAIEQSLQQADKGWSKRVDEFLSGNSWDKTFEGMLKEIRHNLKQLLLPALAPAQKLTVRRAGVQSGVSLPAGKNVIEIERLNAQGQESSEAA